MRGISVGCGLLLVLAGAFLGLIWVFGVALAAAGGADNAVLAGSAAIMAILLGSALAYAGARGGLSAARRRFGPAAPMLWLMLFVAVVLLGSLVIAAGPTATAVLLPPLQVLGAMLPALAVVGAATWRRGGAAWRPTLVGLAYGGCGATTLALIVESTIGMVLLIFILSTPEGQQLSEQFSDLMRELQADRTVGDSLGDLLPLLMTPAIIGSLFLLVGLLGPLSEELAKTVGVALVAPVTRAQAWLWGVTIGAGFGMAEALTFSAMGVGLPNWPVTITTRALTTVMHATMGGLGGLGVYYLTAGRRRGLGVGFILLAWLGHAAWNSAYLLFSLSAATTGMSGSPAWSTTAAALAGASIVLLFGLVVLTFVTVSASTAVEEAAADEAAAIAALRPPDVPPAADDAMPGDTGIAPASADEVADEVADSTTPPELAGPAYDDTPDDEGIPGLGVDSTWRPPAVEQPGPSKPGGDDDD